MFKLLSTRKGVYAFVVFLLSVPIASVLTFVAATGKMSWDAWGNQMRVLFGMVAAVVTAAILGTAAEDAAAKRSPQSVQVQGDNAVVNSGAAGTSGAPPATPAALEPVAAGSTLKPSGWSEDLEPVDLPSSISDVSKVPRP